MLIYQNRVPLHDIISKEIWNRDMTIGILTAMSVEFRQVAAMLGNAQEEKHGTQTYLVGMLGEHKVVLQQCGIGKVNAACGVTQMLMQYQPDCVISTGVAGGIDSKLHVMDVVVSNQVCYHDVWCGEGCDPGQVQGLPTFFPCDKAMLEKVNKHLETSKSANLEFSNELAELLVLANIPNSKKDELYSRHRAAVDAMAAAEETEVKENDGEEA